MLTKTIFEYLGIFSIIVGLLLCGLGLTPISLLAGGGLVATGVAMLYFHYQQMEDQPENIISL